VEQLKKYGPLIKQINDVFQKNVNNYMRSEDLTIVQFDTLLALDQSHQKQLPLKILEQRLHVAQSTAAGIVSRLEQKGLVEGLSDDSDKRIKVVRITPAGMEKIQAGERSLMQVQNSLLSLSRLTETEQDIFYALLKKICDAL